jgi:hypothetical protein
MLLLISFHKFKNTNYFISIFERGPRSITVLSGQRNTNPSTNLIVYNGFEAKLTDKSENHLTSKHGHKFGVDDPLTPGKSSSF